MAFQVTIRVRGYELDTQGHLNQAVYLQYAEHARWELLREAGIGNDSLLAAGIGPVALEITLKFFRELRGGDEVEVTCDFEWGEGKSFRLKQDLLRDGVAVAQLTGVGGIMDLSARRLVANPGERLRALASKPEVLGL